MSKVAIYGRTLPLIPIAAGLTGLIALVGFLVLPQSLLEALVWQTRLDKVLPAAQPPLGGTARLLVAIVAAILAAGVTAFLAWKFSSVGTTKKVRRRRGASRREEVATVVTPAPTRAPNPPRDTISAPVAPATSEKTATRKPSFMNRLRRTKVETEDDIDLENMPVLRRRDFHPDAPARRPLFADAELPGKTLDSVEPMAEPAPAPAMSSPFGSSTAAKFPSWAYEEDCDLTGKNLASHQASDDAPAPIAPAIPPVAEDPELPAQIDELVLGDAHAPGSAGTADWDDPSAFDQYMEAQAEEARADAEMRAAPVEPVATPDINAVDDASTFVPPPVMREESVVILGAQPKPAVEPEPTIWAVESTEEPPIFAPSFDAEEELATEWPSYAAPTIEPIMEPVSEPEAVEALEPEWVEPVLVPPSAPVAPSSMDRIEAALAETTVDDASVDELFARLQAGMTRRAERRAAQAVAAATAPVEAVEAVAPVETVAPVEAAAPVEVSPPIAAAAPVESVPLTQAPLHTANIAPLPANIVEQARAELEKPAPSAPAIAQPFATDDTDSAASVTPLTPPAAPAHPTNPFAAIDPLANLADKEAEVDEALRAALSTLERMNRRAG